MADNQDPKSKKLAGLFEAAETRRRRGKRGTREDERTTLEMTDPLENAIPDELGELLVERGLITRHQLFNALNESYRTGTTLDQAIAAMGLVDSETLAKLVLAAHGK